MTVEQAMVLVEEMNEEAYDCLYQSWKAVDQARENNDENAEELAEKVGDAQAEQFAEEFRNSDDYEKLIALFHSSAIFRESVLQYGGTDFLRNLEKSEEF